MIVAGDGIQHVRVGMGSFCECVDVVFQAGCAVAVDGWDGFWVGDGERGR